MAAKYFGILLLLSISFGMYKCQMPLTAAPNGGAVILGQSIQLSWQRSSNQCGNFLVDFCPGVQTQGCTTLATLPVSQNTYQWTTDRTAIGRLRIQFRVSTRGFLSLDRCGSTYYSSSFSSVFSINCQPLVVNQHPQGIAALLGSSVQFSVSATGTHLSHQWLFNGQPIAGALQPSYVIPSIQIANSGQYSVRVQDTCQTSVTSNTATLRVCPPITIRNFSPILQAEIGSPFILQVDASGQDLQFTWTKEDLILARSNSLNFANFQTEDYGQYAVRIEDACGQHTQLQVMLYSKPFAITASPPTEIFLFVGDSAQLDVQVLKGDFDVAYQWFRDGSAIRGATERSLNIANFSLADSGTRYTISVSADGHTITSEPSTIVAYPSPVILSTLVAPEEVFPGEIVTFSVTAFGQQLHYEWLVDGVVKEDATGLTSLQLTASSIVVNATSVVARVTNPNGLAESDPMQLIVKNQPIFASNEPLEYFLLLNQTVTLDLTDQVLGEQVSFRWLENNSTFIQHNDTMLEVPLDPSIVSTVYQLEATNPSGTTLGPMMWVHPEPAPQIIDQSESPYFYFIGDSPVLYINATGQGVHYRWFRGTELLIASESSQLNLWHLGEQDNLLTIRGEAYNINGFSSSVNITLQLEPAPVIVQQIRTPLLVFLNYTAVLSVQADGHDLEFRWTLTPALDLNVLPTVNGISTIEVPEVVTPFTASAVVRNPSGAVTSNVAHILIHNPPEFVREFRRIVPIVVNTTEVLQRTALGAGVRYTWSLNDTVVLSDTPQDTFQLTRVGVQYNGTYLRVTARNPSGFATAQSMIIVVTRPTLRTPLQSVYEALISSELRVNVDSKDYDVLYEWRHNGTWFRNTTGPLLIQEVHFGMNGPYQLYMHNLAGTSGPIDFRVVIVPLQVRPLNSLTERVFEGDSITLGVQLSTQNFDVLNFAWYLDTVQIEGASTTSLDIANVSAKSGGHYEILISHNRNQGSNVKRSVTTLLILGAPELQQPIYHQPVYDVQAGNTVTLSAIATQGERMSYQWYRNDEPIEGETGRILTFEASYSMKGDKISVVLTNPADTFKSNPVYLHVRFSDVAIAMIVVLAGGALIAGIIVSIIFVRRKMNQQRKISFNKATYGTDDIKYMLLPPWKAPDDSKLATRLDLLPVTFSKTRLTFGGTNLNVNEEYTDTIDINWQGGLKLALSVLHQGKSKKRTSLKPDLNIPLLDTSKKNRSFTVIFHPPVTKKLDFTADPEEIGLNYRRRLTRFSVHDDSTSDETVQFKLELHVSTSVTALIGVEMPEIGKHFYIPCDIVANPSVWIDLDEIEMDPVPVGNGGYGVVYKGQYKGRTVAVKKLHCQEGLHPKDVEEFEREIQFLSELRNPGIVSLIGASKIPGKMAIVTEFITHGSLERWMTKKLPYATKLKIALEVAEAIAFLHKNGVIHRDIKPDNVLVESTDVNSPNMIRLGDFGSARRFVEAKMETFSKGVGTPVYMAPEVSAKKKYSKEADIYSFGILLWVIVTQKEPYMAFAHPVDMHNFVLSGQREAIPAGCPPDYAELITGCWAHEPEKRPPLPIIIEKLKKMLDKQFELM